MEQENRPKVKIAGTLSLVAGACVRHRRKATYLVVAFGLFLLVSYGLFFRAPHNFMPKTTISIPEGASLGSVALILESEHIIRSPFWFKVINIVSGNESSLKAGDYYFHYKENVFTVSKRISEGDFGLTPVIVRIPEGSTVFDVAQILSEEFTEVDYDEFVALAEKESAEGYLFPDTYTFLPNVSERVAHRILRSNFQARVHDLLPTIKEKNLDLHDIVIMASIIEKESADDLEERKTIAGILWNRIEIGMPLQVDATFNYVNGKNTFELTTDDLKIESPYNTYVNKGLPIGPISNPGYDSLLAAVEPTTTDYLFYLHDMDGNIHYSVDFEGHRRNKFRYLR